MTMSGADAAWWRMDRPTNHMVITSVLLLDAPLGLDALRDLLASRLVTPYPRFAQRIADGGVAGPRWVDEPELDLGLHVHRVALPAPGDDAALQALVGDVMAMPLDHSRPLWDVHLVDGHGDGCALVVRIHHCVADGIALARVMLSLTDGADRPSPAKRRSHSTAAALAGAPLRLAGQLAHETLDIAVHPGHALHLGQEAAEDVGALATLLASPRDPSSAIKRRDGAHGAAQRVGWTAPIPLAAASAIAHATDTTVNDVLLTALAGALSRYLDQHLAHRDAVHAMVPFNVRPLDQPLPPELGNQFGLILLALPTGHDAPLVRLASVHYAMKRIKRSRQPQVSAATLAVIGRAPAAVETRLIDYFAARSSAVVTNVPGPRDAVTFAGVPVSKVLVWAPCAGSIGMSVSIFSYRDEITVGFMTHAHLIDDPGALASALEDELAALADAVQPPSSS